jgi:PII-like signaling protein
VHAWPCARGFDQEDTMDGYQITFFTQQDKRHRGEPLGEWLLALARSLHLPGATLIAASEGFGQHGRIHSAHFFELADQPQEVQLVVSAADAARLFERLEAEGVHLFYVKTRVEFGTLGGPAP